MFSMANLATIRDEGEAAQINRNAVAMPNPAAGISYLAVNYIEPRNGADVAQDMSVIMNEAPDTLRQYSAPRITQHTDAMGIEVANDREGVYKNVSETHAINVADNFLGSNEYKALKRAKTNGINLDQPFIALHNGNQDLADLVALAPSHAVEKGATNALIRGRRQAMIANNIVKADGTINRAGTARYDATQTAALPTDETKVYDTNVGFQYAAEQKPTHFQ